MSRLADLKPYLDPGPYLWWLLAGVGLAAVTLSGSLGLVAISGAFLTDTGLAGLIPATAPLYNTVVPAGAIRLLALLRVAGRWSDRVVGHEATLRLLGRLRVRLYGRLSRLSPRQLSFWHGAGVLNRLTRDVDLLDNLFVRVLSPTVAAVLVVSISILVVGAVSPAAGVVAALAVATAVMLVLLYAAGKNLTPRLVQRHDTLRTAVLDLIEGMDDSALHQPAWRAQRQTVLDEDLHRTKDHSALARRGSGARALLTLLIALAAAGTGFWSAAAGTSGPWCVALTLLVLGLSEALLGLPTAWLELSGTAAAARRVSELADRRPDPTFVDETAAAPGPAEFTLSNVGFAYEGGDAVLSGLSLRWPLGTHVAVLGPSGGGKSTLVRLLTRLEDPTEGQVVLGGVDLKEWDESSLRNVVACSPQDPWVFRMTLLENLRLAAPQAAESDLWNVLDIVGLSDQVRAWPRGLGTLVEEGGASLSGGQRRRLAVAQALLRNAPVTILDEPTEGLDAAAALALATAVQRHLRGRTLVWVTHRPEGLETFQLLPIEFRDRSSLP